MAPSAVLSNFSFTVFNWLGRFTWLQWFLSRFVAKNHQEVVSVQPRGSGIVRVVVNTNLDLSSPHEGRDPNQTSLSAWQRKGWVRCVDPERLGFIETLGTVRFDIMSTHALDSALTEEDILGYQIIVVEVRSGLLIALKEARQKGHALFLFDATHPNWFAGAKLSREEMREHPACLGRFCHGPGWQDRVRQRIEQWLVEKKSQAA